ncbi:MAG: DUF4071 domain-containing protein, partial [Bacteroidota bacterium]
MNTKICFVIMGFGKKTDAVLGKTYDLDATYHSIIKPSAEAAGYQCIRGDEIMESGIIDKGMYALLIHADLVIADITTFNPNAVYELGIRHAAKPFSTIVMKEKEGNIPFDINHNKIFTYTHMGEDIGITEAKKCIQRLTQLINRIEATKEVDSPLFHHIPNVKPYTLPEEDYIQLIKDWEKREGNIFALTEQARIQMDAEDFASAKKTWKKLALQLDHEPFFTQ